MYFNNSYVNNNKKLYLFQESDILESPGIYFRSSLMDKVSDYEDIWGPEGNNCTTFKPLKSENDSNFNNGLMKSKRPDLLPDTLRKYIFLKGELQKISKHKQATSKLLNLNNLGQL